jgi:two-component sensor histidine kinase
LSKAHDVLTREYWKSAPLREIISEAIKPFDGEEPRRIHVEGPEAEVQPRLALSLSMALHELLTNAAKYGALSSSEGAVSIIWSIRRTCAGSRLVLRWAESDGPPVEAPSKMGFGTRLIRTGLSRELGGEADLRFEHEGVVCTFDLPLQETGDGDGANIFKGSAPEIEMPELPISARSSPLIG